MLKGKCIIMPTGEMEQSRCSCNSDPAYQASLAHLLLPFVILFFWGYTFTGKEYKKLLQKETGKVIKYWPSGQGNELYNYRMLCGKICTDRRCIKRVTVHVISLDRSKRKKKKNLTFSPPYFSGYIWQLWIAPWCSCLYFTPSWSIFLPFLPQLLSPQLKLTKKKEEEEKESQDQGLGLAHNSAWLRGVCFWHLCFYPWKVGRITLVPAMKQEPVTPKQEDVCQS